MLDLYTGRQVLCLEIIPFFYCTSQTTKDLLEETTPRKKMTKAFQLVEGIGANHAAVKSPSKSMEEVTRVSHFVGSSGKESERERGVGVGQSVRREGHIANQELSR